MEVIKNTEELREAVLDELSKLKEGFSTPAKVNAVSNATGKTISTIRIELEYAKLKGIIPEIDFIRLKTSKSKPSKG